MNRTASQRLYAFDDYVWRQVIEIISGTGPDVLAITAPGSGWPSLRNCLAHIIFGYDRWVGIMTATPLSSVSEQVQSLPEIDAARTSLRDSVDSILDGLSDDDLQEIRPFAIDDERMPYSHAELLTHLALHERGHHGDITTLFWQLGLEAATAFEYRFH